MDECGRGKRTFQRHNHDSAPCRSGNAKKIASYNDSSCLRTLQQAVWHIDEMHNCLHTSFPQKLVFIQCGKSAFGSPMKATAAFASAYIHNGCAIAVLSSISLETANYRQLVTWPRQCAHTAAINRQPKATMSHSRAD